MIEDPIIRFLNTFGVQIFVILVIVYLAITNKKLEAIHAFVSALVAGSITLILKELFFTARPYIVDGDMALAGQALSSSFPSMHTTLAFAVAATVYLHHKRMGMVLFLVAVVIGIGRVLANVHYPWDILGGALLGMLIALFVDRVYPAKYNPRKK